jgi:hypothetical protein
MRRLCCRNLWLRWRHYDFAGIRTLGTLDGIAIGTSQIIDCSTYGMAFLTSGMASDSDAAWWRLFDWILETGFISGLETDSTRYV